MRLELAALCLIVILFWGLWAFFYKVSLLGAEKLGLVRALFCAYLFCAILSVSIAGFLVFKLGTPQTTDFKSYAMIALATTFGIIGTILWYFCIYKYQASVVVPFTALYPFVTVLLGIFILKE